jgi:hypothetical protein
MQRSAACTPRPAPRGPSPVQVMGLEAERFRLDLSGPSLTNTDTVLLSHDVCTAMTRTHKCGLDLTHEQSSRPYLFKSKQRFKYLKMSLLQCSHLW